MAEFVGGFGVPHTPLLWHLMDGEVPDDLVPVKAAFRRSRAQLEAARPDALVIVASDHFHQYHHGVMPAFAIGKADHIQGTHDNEERSFGLPAVEMPGHPRLAESILGREQLSGGFDFTFSNAPVLDHAYVVPLLYLRPDMDIPVVPIHTNTNAPPLPSAQRFVDLGHHIRAVIREHPERIRVAVIASGHMAYELGGPNQFSGRSTDPEFDAEAARWMGQSRLDAAVEACTFDRLTAAGNLTLQFLNFLTLAAIAGRPADEVAPVECRFGNEPFFTWEAS